MSSGPAATFQNDQNCQHYAGFMAHLSGQHFTAMYWSLFFLVIFMLFVNAAIFQWASARKEEHEKGLLTDKVFKKRWVSAMLTSLTIFLITAVFCIMEVFILMALQFCQGEPLISLYWSSWMMLQLGSEVAILGVVLAMFLHLRGIDHPKWALALGTPVLVVAGFGYTFTHFAEKNFRKVKADVKMGRRFSRSTTFSRTTTKQKESAYSSAAPSIRPEPSRATLDLRDDRASRLEAGVCGSPQLTPSLPAVQYFSLDAGGDERIRGWPAFMGMSDDGKAVLCLTPMPSFVPNSALPVEPRSTSVNT